MKLSAEQLAELRELLGNEAEDTEIQVRGMAGVASATHGDSGDLSSSEWATELSWELEDHEVQQLHHVEAALARMAEGAYGVCESCGEDIPFQRLKVMPTARYCVKCQAERERQC